MNKQAYVQVLSELKQLRPAYSEKKPVKITLFSNVTVHPLQELIEHNLLKEGVPCKVETATFDNIAQEASIYSDSDISIVLWDIINILDDEFELKETKESSEYELLLDRVTTEINLFFNGIGKNTTVIFNRFSALLNAGLSLEKNGADRLSEDLNTYIDSLEYKNLRVIDTTKLIGFLGATNSFDRRMYKLAKAPYSLGFLSAYVNMIAPVLYSAVGKVKKVLVLDCDNTLWKGIVGEDGLEGIKVFKDIQKEIVALVNKGLVVCLCSKNNPEDVDEVLDKHPDMLLRNEHIVLKKVSWNNKSDSIQEMAKRLNLGLDSFVFMDDSDFEINLVREKIPEVSCFHVPANETEYWYMMDEVKSLFYRPSVTSEDKKKAQMYKMELAAEQEREQYSSIDDFLKSLELSFTVNIDCVENITRYAQLCQKTNQFNLTTKRYSEKDIHDKVSHPHSCVISIDVRDRFGEKGITGLAIVELQEDIAKIDSFLMSCRVLGRKIEYRFVQILVEVLQKRGIKTLKASYLPSQRNNQVSDFWDKFNFNFEEEQGGEKIYSCSINDFDSEEDTSFIGVIYE